MYLLPNLYVKILFMNWVIDKFSLILEVIIRIPNVNFLYVQMGKYTYDGDRKWENAHTFLKFNLRHNI